MCLVGRVAYVICFMRLLNLQLDLQLHQMPGPKKINLPLPSGLKFYFVCQVKLHSSGHPHDTETSAEKKKVTKLKGVYSCG